MLNINREMKGRILDIGGGGEGVIGRLYKNQVIAIDNCQEELDEAPNCCSKVLMDATHLEFSSREFDHVTFFYSLMFMNTETQKQALAEAARVLKVGGALHIWDAEIASAYPVPFRVDLDIQLDDEVIHTTFGCASDVINQNATTFTSICLGYGLIVQKQIIDDGRFYLLFEKNRQ